MAGASGILQALRSPDTSQPFQRLVPFSWPTELALICAGMLASFLVAGFWYPYWRIADMDFMMVYNAFLLNDRLPQEYFDHPGYLSILLLSYWLRALHSLGILQVQSLSAVPPFSNAAASDSAWMQATQAGRVLSLIFAIAFVLAFSYLLRALVRDWRVAAFAGFLLAFSGGLAIQMRIIRTEFLPAAFFVIALLMMIVVTTRGPRAWRPAVIGLASLLMTLGMLDKVQIFFLICALPLLLLPFGEISGSGRAFWDTPGRAWPAVAAAAAIALCAAYFAHHLVAYGLTHTGDAALRLVALRIGTRTYWALTATWIALGMIAYAVVWRVSALETLAAMLAAVAGCMIGLLALYIRYAPDNALVVFHPLEQLLGWAAISNPDLATGTSFLNATRLEFAVRAVANVIATRTFILHSSARPTIFLEWFVIAATVIAIRRREWRLVLQVAVLMLADWGMDTLDAPRGLKGQYFILADPLAIIAAALLIARLADLQVHRWAYPVGVALIASHIVLSQAEPVKFLFSKRGPDVLCSVQHYTKRIEPLPFCAPASPPGAQ